MSLWFSALYAKCPYYYLVLYMQSVLIIECYICNVSLLFTALYATCPYYYAKCPYYVVLYMQSVLIMHCFILFKVSLLVDYYVVLYIKSVLITQCFICNVSLLLSASHEKCSCLCSALCNVSVLCSALYTSVFIN